MQDFDIHTHSIASGHARRIPSQFIENSRFTRTVLSWHFRSRSGNLPVNYKELFLATKEKDVLLEINNASLLTHSYRPRAKENRRVSHRHRS